MADYREIIDNGLWKQNPGVVQLLGLCPTLAVTSTVIMASRSGWQQRW
jgi:Na+-translocating ferredoxin:NAD+ oxidoreductase subunit E